VKACSGEIIWGSREEDNSKIDLVLSCEHPWYAGERMLVLCQAKSGPAYGELRPTGVKIKTRAIREARRTTHSICILWVDRDTGRGFCSYINPFSRLENQILGKHHEVSPASLYDLARQMSYDRPVKTGASGLIIRQRSSDLTARRSSVKTAYRSIKTVFSPTLGEIELTRIAWRHMFRKGRSAPHKQASLDIIPYLSNILSQKPSATSIVNSSDWISGKYSYRNIEYLLRYDRARMARVTQKGKPSKIQILIRVIEEVRYPADWAMHAMLTQLVERRLVLKAAYHKVSVSVQTGRKRRRGRRHMLI